MYNNISYNKDYYTIEKLMNSRKQNPVVYENDNCMWLAILTNRITFISLLLLSIIYLAW